MLPDSASAATVTGDDHDDSDDGACTYFSADRKSVPDTDSVNATYALPAVSSAIEASCVPTIWPVDERSTASDCDQVTLSVDVATQSRVGGRFGRWGSRTA